MKKTIRLTESELKHFVKKSIGKILKEGLMDTIRFNWSITVRPENADKMYQLQQKLDNANWVEDFEHDEESNQTQKLSVNPSRLNEGTFDEIRNNGWDERMEKIGQLAKECLEIAKDESPNGFGERALYFAAKSILDICKRFGYGY